MQIQHSNLHFIPTELNIQWVLTIVLVIDCEALMKQGDNMSVCKGMCKLGVRALLAESFDL